MELFLAEVAGLLATLESGKEEKKRYRFDDFPTAIAVDKCYLHFFIEER